MIENFYKIYLQKPIAISTIIDFVLFMIKLSAKPLIKTLKKNQGWLAKAFINWVQNKN